MLYGTPMSADGWLDGHDRRLDVHEDECVIYRPAWPIRYLVTIVEDERTSSIWARAMTGDDLHDDRDDQRERAEDIEAWTRSAPDRRRAGQVADRPSRRGAAPGSDAEHVGVEPQDTAATSAIMLSPRCVAQWERSTGRIS